MPITYSQLEEVAYELILKRFGEVTDPTEELIK